MDDKIKKQTFTVLGRDTLVPVGVVGEQTGPARPSASDCLAPPIGSQAAVQNTTGHTVLEKGNILEIDKCSEHEAFRRRDSIGRSPPPSRRGSSPTVVDSTESAQLSTDIGRFFVKIQENAS